jgi:hypothetical protein
MEVTFVETVVFSRRIEKLQLEADLRLLRGTVDVGANWR